MGWPEQMELVAAYIRDFRERMAQQAMRRAIVIPDVTGVGDGVKEELYRALAKVGISEQTHPHPIFIKNAGAPTPRPDGGRNGSITDLIDNAAVLVQRNLVRFAPDIPLLEHLYKEFLAYRIDKSHRTNPNADAYSGWGKAQSDDLVFAFILALWVAENRLSTPTKVDLKGLVLVDAPVNVVRG
jgi:hypothetical protein